MRGRWLLATGLSLVLGMAAAADRAPMTQPEVVATYPHDRDAFTQGLVFHGEQLLESTGQRGRSELRWVDLASGRVERRIPLSPRLFGEGLAITADHRLVQLTWQAGRALVWSRYGRLLNQWSYRGEGWGLTFDGQALIRSDGSETLTWHETEDFTPIRRLRVTDGGQPVRRLNELEWVRGHLLANVWQTRRIAIIAPESGRVVEWLDLSHLDANTPAHPGSTLNGIAWLETPQRLFVTGKRWGTLYEIEVPTRLRRPERAPQGMP